MNKIPTVVMVTAVILALATLKKRQQMYLTRLFPLG